MYFAAMLALVCVSVDWAAVVVESRGGRHVSTPPIHKALSVEAPQRETGLHESTRLCLEQIRDAMLHHRWEEAAEYMEFFQQILEDSTHNHEAQYKEQIWRMGIEILHHHPNSKQEDYNTVYERIKHTGVKQFLKQSFHLLINGQIQEAKNMLTIAESWRHGKETAIQMKRTKLIQAYRSLLDYVIWCEKEEVLSKGFHLFIFSDLAQNVKIQSMHKCFQHASTNMKEIFKFPGVWDPFILSYVEMLEFYDDEKEALRILKEYAYNNAFPPNPNAHVYLYQYLKRHNEPNKKLLKVLKVQKLLFIIKDFKDTVSKVMSGRMDWWPALHFTTFHAAQDQRENLELWRLKAPLAKVLCPGNCSVGLWGVVIHMTVSCIVLLFHRYDSEVL
uniref:Uncharacterized protein n=1 Tax=Periophthalmus magnuspinnatus TaxID=409849 RepID=A0A3B4BBJ6_9GOBI